MSEQHKYQVHIKMESVGEDDSITQLAEGDLYLKAGSWFLRYEEPESEQGAVTATIRISNDQIKLMRRGAVDSDMTFERNVAHPGLYASSAIRIQLETVATDIQVELSEGKGTISWTYYLNSQDGSSSPRRVSVLLS